MDMRKKIKAVVVAIGSIALLSAIGNAQARLSYNGMMLNGFNVNALSLNGLSFNGMVLNGYKHNALSLNAMNFNGRYLNALSLNAMNLNGRFFNALSLNGIFYNGMSINGSMLSGKSPWQLLPNYVEKPAVGAGRASRISASNGQLIIEFDR